MLSPQGAPPPADIPEPFSRFVVRLVAIARRRIAAEEAARRAEKLGEPEADVRQD